MIENEKSYKESMEKLLIKEADRLSQLLPSTDDYAKTSRLVTDLFKELNSAERNQIDDKNDFEKIQNDYEIKRKELEQKEYELDLEKKKSKKEFIGKITTAGLSVAIPLIIAIIEPKGFFVKLTNWKTQKF